MTPNPIPGAIRGETPEQAERRASVEAILALSHDEYRRRVAELSRPAPVPIPVIAKSAWDMTTDEFAAAIRQLRNHH